MTLSGTRRGVNGGGSSSSRRVVALELQFCVQCFLHTDHEER